MLIPSISNETNPLQCVLLGVADQSGPIPKYEEAYDPKSRLHIAKGNIPQGTRPNSSTRFDACCFGKTWG
jgi:hypothetical protein